MSTTEKWRKWQKRMGVTGQRYAELYARLVRSPKAQREYSGR